MNTRLISIFAVLGVGMMAFAPGLNNQTGQFSQDSIPVAVQQFRPTSLNANGSQFPKGHQVVRIGLDSTDALSELLMAGDRVNLIGLAKDEKGRTVSRILVKNLTVCSVPAGNRNSNAKTNHAIERHIFVIATDDQAEIVEFARPNIKVVLVAIGEVGCPGCTPGKTDCGACCGIDWQEPTEPKLQIPDNHEIVSLKSSHSLEGKVQPGDKAALVYCETKSGRTQSRVIARDLVVFGVAHQHRSPNSDHAATDIVQIVVPSRLAKFVSRTKSNIKVRLAGVGGACPDCTPGRMDCGVCCGDDWEQSIDWSEEGKGLSELSPAEVLFQSE